MKAEHACIVGIAVLCAIASASACKSQKVASTENLIQSEEPAYKILTRSFSPQDQRHTVDLVSTVASDPRGRTMVTQEAAFDFTRQGWTNGENGIPQDAQFFLWNSPEKKEVLAAVVVIPDAKTSAFLKPQKSTKNQPRTKPRTRAAKRSPRQVVIAAIKRRCQNRMGAYGSSLVKACVDNDIDAYDALARYPDRFKSIIDRCKRTMLSLGGMPWTG